MTMFPGKLLISMPPANVAMKLVDHRRGGDLPWMSMDSIV
eukprot:CAMPEP_0170647636 /NCGR_PEP_ID=MMETSP0224-20130122/44289_1 /TAXON_ID=285029 /ORGANISM="Togula jolla, Strain CCCM 725" /LENGTH=39 /DNA_ID= /DNA_START= /DNA_END= /DNA_ORIENTATION=